MILSSFFWPFGRQRWFSRRGEGLNFQKISPLITGRRWQPWEERHSFQQENSNIYLWFFLHTMNIQLYISEINSLTKLLCIHLTNCCNLAWRIFPEDGKRKPNYHSKGFPFVHSPAHAKKTWENEAGRKSFVSDRKTPPTPTVGRIPPRVLPLLLHICRIEWSKNSFPQGEKTKIEIIIPDSAPSTSKRRAQSHSTDCFWCGRKTDR